MIALINGFISFLSGVIVPFLIAVAGLVFIWNIFQLFIVKGASATEHEKARTYATWSLIAFVFVVSIWGIVNILVVGALGDGISSSVKSDYIEEGESRGVNWTLPRNNTSSDENPENVPFNIDCDDNDCTDQ